MNPTVIVIGDFPKPEAQCFDILYILLQESGMGISSFALRSFTLVALLKRATGVNHSCCSVLKEQWKSFALDALY